MGGLLVRLSQARVMPRETSWAAGMIGVPANRFFQWALKPSGAISVGMIAPVVRRVRVTLSRNQSGGEGSMAFSPAACRLEWPAGRVQEVSWSQFKPTCCFMRPYQFPEKKAR